MQTIIRISVLGVLVSLGAVPAMAASILINGDLNDPGLHEMDLADGWMLSEGPLALNTATFATFADRLGGGVGLWLRPFVGEAEDPTDGDDEVQVFAHLTQTLPAIPGADYSLTAWARFEANYAGGVDMLASGAPSPTETYLALEFLDAASTVLPGSVLLELRDGGQMNDNNWLQHVLNATAPAGIPAHIRVRAVMMGGVLNPGVNPQSAFFDDFTLEVDDPSAIPEPATLLLIVSGLGAAAARRRSRRAP